MGRSTYAVVAALASVAALAILSPLATDTLPGHGAVTGGPQGCADDPGRLDGSFAEAHDLVGHGLIGQPHSDPAYRDMMVVVAKYDENGGDISDGNKAAVVEMLKGVGARDIEAAETLSLVTASVPAERILDVSGHDLVCRVGYDWALSHPTIGKMRVTVGATADDLRRPSGMIANGSGVTVGIVDEGVNHPLGVNDKVVGRISCDDLSCSYIPVEDVVGPDPGNQGVSHGTLVALVIAGSGFPEHNGIAPGVSILDAGLSLFYLGAGDASISHAFSWLLREDADVANLSFGFGKCRESGIGATRQLITGGAVDNGMVVVVSSGNQGDFGSGQNQVPVYQSVNQWGCAHNVITVGGINDRDLDNIQMYSGSGKGPATHSVNSVTYPILKPEIVAPAVLQVPQYTANGATTLISGTSFSTPAVSAVAALVLQERDMEPAAVKTAILLGANWTGPVPCTSVQYERYNATDNCSHGRQPGSFIEGGSSLEIVNNVGFGILDAAKTLDYVSQASGRHLVEDNLDSDTNIDGYTFEVTDAENPVKIILSWTVDMFYDGYYDPRGKNYFADLGFTVSCPGMDTISAQSAYQASEFAVFTPAEAGTCTIAVMGSDIDTPRRSQQDYALASTLPLDAIDIERPGPTISSSEQSPTNSHNITFTVDFGESVDAGTFAASDVSASAGTVSDPLPANGTAEAFAFEVSDINAGNLTVSIPEGGVLDLAGNNNTASDPYVIEIDRTRPAPVLSAAVSSPVNASSITFTVDFGEQVDRSTFDPSDVSASSGTVSDPLPANGTAGTFTFEVSDLAAGNLTVSIPEGGVLDLAGNNNTASNPYVAEIKRPRPSSTISTAEPSLTNAHRITFTVDFGVPVDAGTFAASDVSASAGTVSDPLPANGTARTFTFEVSDMAAGNLTVSIPEGGVLDLAGNNNTASDPYVIEIDRTRPAPVLSAAVSSPVNASSITFTVDFGEQVDRSTFDPSDVSTSAGTMSDLLPVNGTAGTFTFEVSDLAAGNLTVSIPEGGVLDPVGNNNTPSNLLTLTVTRIPAGTTPDAAFVTTWQTTSANESILIPVGESTGTYTVTWGDASIDADVSGHQRHTYKAAGTYTVSIYGDFSQIYLPYSYENSLKLQSIEQWGDIRWESMRGAFSGATNMVYRATDAPDLSAVTDTSEMFMFALRFNGNLSNWNVSSVTDASSMFAIARAFNGDISSWNVSGMTDMSNMLDGTNDFAWNLGDWYIVLDDTTMSDANETLAISAQNAYLDGQNPTYAVDDATGNGALFEVISGDLAIKSGQNPAPGSYNITITSTGSFGTDNSRVVEIAVSIAQSNNLPVADAGNTQTALEGSIVTLNGTASDLDPEDSLAYSWSHNSTLAISLDDQNAEDPEFTAPNVGSDTVVEFTLTVDDGTATASDKVIVTITDRANVAPTVSAGSGQAAAEGSMVTLNGTASDLDPEDSLAYSWSHNSTLAISLDDQNAEDPEFTAPNVGSDTVVEFTLTVDDGTATASDKVIVTITDRANVAPTVSAGSGQAAAEGSMVTLNGTASDLDPEDSLAYSWSHNSTLAISLDDQNAEDPEFTAPNVGSDTVVEFTLTVSDGTATASDKVIVTITDRANVAPTVSAGSGQAAAEGSMVTLNGTAFDANPEDSLAYSWSHNSTLAISLDDQNAEDPEFTAPNVGSDTVVEFTLTVSDGTATASDKVIVTITDRANVAPTVSAGSGQAAAEGSMVTLNGTAFDADPEDSLAYSWSHNSTLAISLDDQNAEDPEFTAPNVGSDTVVEFTLTVDDGTATASDKVIVTITDRANVAPTVSAGSGQAAAEGSMVTLNGTAFDADPEDSLAYSWSHNSTLAISLDDQNAEDPEFTAPNVGSDTVVEFTLTVDDGTATASDKVIITITDSPAQVSQSDPRGVYRLTLSSTESGVIEAIWDAPGNTPADYRISWAKTGESFRTWTDLTGNAFPTGTSHTISGLEDGEEYTVKVRARYDGSAGPWSDASTITATGTAPNQPANNPPVADAGNTQTALEGSIVTLNGTAFDADPEDSLAYSWSHNSTLAISLDDQNAEDPEFTAPNVGSDTVVEFTLTVDDGTATASDKVIVTITDRANVAPTVSAGSGQAAAEGSMVTLNGTAFDADPEDSLAYSWSHNSTLAISLDDQNAEDPEFTAPNVGSDTVVEFTLTVDDGTATASDKVIVTITDRANVAPTVSAGSGQAAAEGSMVTLNGTAFDADPEDSLAYSWSHNSTLAISLDDQNAEDPEFTAPNVGSDTVVEFTLTVDDGTATASDKVIITITDSPAQVSQSDPRGVYRLTLSSTESGVIEAIWDAPGNTPADYRISWAKTGESFRTWTDLTGNAFPTGTSHTISGLEEGEEYTVKVRARYDGTAGDWSDGVTVTVAGTG